MQLVALALVALMAIGAPGSTESAFDTCTQDERATTGCPTATAGINGDHVDVSANQPGGGNSGGGSNGGGGGPATPPARDPSCAPAPAICTVRQDFTVVRTPTLADIAAFRPTPGVDHMEPNGWFVTGLDANFYATGGSSVVPGTLLGNPASVRFTPIRWAWTYGDGASATRSTRGATWKAQGIHAFDPTSTSHVYEKPGTYYIDLTIGYRAEYSYDGSNFVPIVGTLWLPANRLVATVGGAKTVLVERDCAANPSGPGC